MDSGDNNDPCSCPWEFRKCPLSCGSVPRPPTRPPSYLLSSAPGSVLLLQLHLRLCPDALSTEQAGGSISQQEAAGRSCWCSAVVAEVRGAGPGAPSSPPTPFRLLVPASMGQKALPVTLLGRLEPGEGDVTQEPQVAGWREGVCG